MKQKHPGLFYVVIVSLWVVGFFVAHAMNHVPQGLPTIQKMQSVILQHPMGEAMTVINFYPKSQQLHVWIDSPLTFGTDAMCEAFSQIIWGLMMLDSRLIIVVDGEWVPSRQNPIDFSWAKVLMEHASL